MVWCWLGWVVIINNFLKAYAIYLFLAAISSSRSDDVTKFVRLWVRAKEFQQVFQVLRILKVSRMFPVSFLQKVSWKFIGGFKEVLRLFKVRLKGISSNFRGVSREFERSLKGVGSFNGVSMLFQGHFNEVSRVFQ